MRNTLNRFTQDAMPSTLLLKMISAIGTNPFIGITIIDQNGVIVFRNKGMERISGIAVETAIGKRFKDVSNDPTLLKVLESEESQLGCLYQTPSSEWAVIHRIPLKLENQTIGAMSIAAFNDMAELKEVLQKNKILKGQVEYLQRELNDLRGSRFSFDNIIGVSKSILELKKFAERCAKTNASILILGESGTGKEVFAHAIHCSSGRREGPLIRLNCSAFPQELLESELFGYDGGAFSGARREGKPGKFELADRGTIFLDEISDLPFNLQPKLLRVIEEKIIERVGGTKPRLVDFRLIAATNKDLHEMARCGKFREDLLFRLNSLTVSIPPLRERKEDIPLFTEHILAELNKELGTNYGIDPSCMEILKNYRWPGNVRELRNLITRAVTIVSGNIVEPSHLPTHLFPPQKSLTKKGKKKQPFLQRAMDQSEEDLITMAIKTAKGNKARAARILEISRTSLYEKLTKMKKPI